MGHLPIPAKLFFDDFANDVLKYNVLDNKVVLGTYQGLSNSDEDGKYIGFLMSDNPLISVGNVLCTADGLQKYRVRQISYDRYNGEPELFKAYY